MTRDPLTRAALSALKAPRPSMSLTDFEQRFAELARKRRRLRAQRVVLIVVTIASAALAGALLALP